MVGYIMVAAPLIFFFFGGGGDLKTSDQNNWGGTWAKN